MHEACAENPVGVLWYVRGMNRHVIVAALVAALAACGGRSGPSFGSEGWACLPDDQCDDGLTCRADVCVGEDRRTQILGSVIRDVDVLFVVDDSNSMRDAQAALVASFPSFAERLSTLEGGLPNLHIGVVSTNVGAGTGGIAGCENSGDNGLLQNTARGACEVPSDRYINDVANSDGSRTKNYSGSLTDTFSCIAELGSSGCGFEQPLEAMRRALNGSNAQNQGFLRPNAMLAVIVLTDEDDCSTEDLAMFNTDAALDNVDSALGPLASFRCFEFGVQCSPDNPREPGSRDDCRARENSQYMYGTEEYARFLQNLKGPSVPVAFFAIAGVGPVVVGSNDGEPRLEPACGLGNGGPIADPAVRIADLAGRMGMPAPSSICEGVDLTAAAENMYGMLSGLCLSSPEPEECTFADVANLGETDEEIVQDLPLCESASFGACAQITQNSASCQGALTEVVIDRRGTTAPAGTVVVASCPL